MMSYAKKITVCPTVTARSAKEYREQMERIAPFVERIHIDVADGEFAPVKLSLPQDVWWPHGVRADIHAMLQSPTDYLKDFIRLSPRLVIVHAEADGEFIPFANALHAHGIRVGVALKSHTQVDVIKGALRWIDHVLIFSGDLGHFGGRVNTHLLTKALLLRKLKPSLEIGWDGGINDRNAGVLAAGGVNVLNTGGFIHHAANPHDAYDKLVESVAAGKRKAI